MADAISEIAGNSIEAGAENVVVIIDETLTEFDFTIVDDGCGFGDSEISGIKNGKMPKSTKHKAEKNRGGLNKVFSCVKSCGGEWTAECSDELGTVIQYSFPKNSGKCPPKGDFAGTFAVLAAQKSSEITWHRYSSNGKSCHVSSKNAPALSPQGNFRLREQIASYEAESSE